MNVRRVAPLVVALAAATSPARADESLTLAPSCAAIDEARDTLAPEERAVALTRLQRKLMDANMLVVEQDCTDHYVLSHEHEGERPIVRVAGPTSVRLVRDPGATGRGEAYGILIEELLASEARDATTPVEAAYVTPTPLATNQPEFARSVDPGVAEDGPQLRTDAVLYARLLAGTHGMGFGVGARIPVTTAAAIDLSFGGAGKDQADIVMGAAKVIAHRDPDNATLYYGGGFSLAAQSAQYMHGSGVRLEGVIGIAMNRTRQTRVFLEGNVGIPLYTLDDGSSTSYEPTFMMSLAVGR